MKLLMITRKVDNNDALAGFAYNWVREIGANLEKLYVITWQKSDTSGLAENIEVISLPTDKIKKVFYLQKYLWRILPQVDGVFCHMNPEYTILSALLAKIFGKRIVSWYTHRQITWKRRLLECLADKIVTASEESFRDPLYPAKVAVINHGIDVDFFRPLEKNKDDKFTIISVGRISPTKDYESIIKAVDVLDDLQIYFKVIGDVILDSQKKYLEVLKKMTQAMELEKQVEFVGWVANKDTVLHYQTADLFINMSGTGSVDKAVLEAMACGVLVLTSNEAFVSILPSELIIEKNDYKMLAQKIVWIKSLSDKEKSELSAKLRNIVVSDHNLKNLAQKIVTQFK